MNMQIKKGGTLRFYGEWFGRPYDNYHRVINAEFNEHIMVIRFDNGETCTIYNPQNIVNNENGFSVLNASKIVLEWYPYGDKHTVKDLCKKVYTFQDDKKVVVENSGLFETGSKEISPNGCFAFEICSRTEKLEPHVSSRRRLKKWVLTIICFAVIIAGIMALIY